MSNEADIKPEPNPELHLPKGDTAVEISMLNTTTNIVCPAEFFVEPIIKGHEFLNFPTVSFYIRHPSGKEILFDCGSRKDYWNLAPAIYNHLKHVVPAMSIDKGVDEILGEGNVDLKGINSIIWSHWHYDHTGDPSK